MGFTPIFITLGGFVFLFVMLVNYNLNSKKKSYFLLLEALKKMVAKTYPQVKVGSDVGLKALEHQFREMKKQFPSTSDSGKESQIKAQFASCKLARFQYQQLKETKPYYFVAQLFGHGDI